VILAIAMLTVVNLAIIAVAGLGATHYMETEQFCGQVCHVPMRPEFTAHKVSPHAHVTCVACHVSPGAAGTVRAKMNGTRQLVLLASGDFARPIPVPARGLPVAADTCQRCHSLIRMPAEVTRSTYTFADDEANTESVMSMVMQTGRIHWHARPEVRVEYVAADPGRESIPYVKVSGPDGVSTEYFGPDVAARPPGELRRMDCLDCHTRPAHTFSPSAEQAVDRAIAAGDIDRTLPFIRRETVAALTADYADERAAVDAIRARLNAFYKDPDASRAAAIARSIASAERLYRTNVFPEMKVSWGTYKSQLGHTDLPGCARCHDDQHKARDGKLIRQDCELCHRMQ
jgi:hypothetical protein